MYRKRPLISLEVFFVCIRNSQFIFTVVCNFTELAVASTTSIYILVLTLFNLTSFNFVAIIFRACKLLDVFHLFANSDQLRLVIVKLARNVCVSREIRLLYVMLNLTFIQRSYSTIIWRALFDVVMNLGDGRIVTALAAQLAIHFSILSRRHSIHKPAFGVLLLFVAQMTIFEMMAMQFRCAQSTFIPTNFSLQLRFTVSFFLTTPEGLHTVCIACIQTCYQYTHSFLVYFLVAFEVRMILV